MISPVQEHVNDSGLEYEADAGLNEESEESALPKKAKSKKKLGRPKLTWTTQLMHMIMQNPKTPNDELVAKLQKDGHGVTKFTVVAYATHFKIAIKVLQSEGALRRDIMPA